MSNLTEKLGRKGDIKGHKCSMKGLGKSTQDSIVINLMPEKQKQHPPDTINSTINYKRKKGHGPLLQKTAAVPIS